MTRLHSISPPRPDVSDRRTRRISEVEVAYLADYIADIRARNELERLRREEAFVRIEPTPTLREGLWLLAGALLAAVIGLVLYSGQS